MENKMSSGKALWYMANSRNCGKTAEQLRRLISSFVESGFQKLNIEVTCKEMQESESTISALRAELEHQQRQLADAMSGCCDCPMLKSSNKENKKLKAELERTKLAAEKLKWQLAKFKSYGSTDCMKCETGRISIFTANEECMKCNPKSYDTYEQREALAQFVSTGGGKDG